MCSFLVPDYDVAAPFQTDENGNFVSHEFLLHAKHKRSTEEPNAWYFNIKAFGMSLHLNLTRNKDFLAPDLRIERHQNGTVNYEDVPQDSFLRGHVNSVPGSSVSISHDHGLVSNIPKTVFLTVSMKSHIKVMSCKLKKGTKRPHRVIYNKGLK